MLLIVNARLDAEEIPGRDVLVLPFKWMGANSRLVELTPSANLKMVLDSAIVLRLILMEILTRAVHLNPAVRLISDFLRFTYI